MVRFPPHFPRMIYGRAAVANATQLLVHPSLVTVSAPFSRRGLRPRCINNYISVAPRFAGESLAPKTRVFLSGAKRGARGALAISGVRSIEGITPL
ncbi:unnamed protein product, partial [Iphiclides podalirius]